MLEKKSNQEKQKKMITIHDLKNYLEKYESVWWDIEDSNYPVMDVSTDIVDERNYYGYDFSGNQSVYMLFFSGSSNYFPGLYCPSSKEPISVDTCPIYIFDLSITGKECKFVGNFRTFIFLVLSNYLKGCKNQNFIQQAELALKELEQFSTELIDDTYTLKKTSFTKKNK